MTEALTAKAEKTLAEAVTESRPIGREIRALILVPCIALLLGGMLKGIEMLQAQETALRAGTAASTRPKP